MFDLLLHMGQLIGTHSTTSPGQPVSDGQALDMAAN
jgi:hypothetical protein